MLSTLFIVNRYGGLIYTKRFSPRPALSENQYLRIASTIHSLHEISQQICPLLGKGKSGFHLIESDEYLVHCFKALTGVMILVVGDTREAVLEQFVQRVYAAYSDYALKNPFYQLDQVVKSDKFEAQLDFLARDVLRQIG